MDQTFIDRMIEEDLQDPEFRAAYEAELEAEDRLRPDTR